MIILFGYRRAKLDRVIFQARKADHLQTIVIWQHREGLLDAFQAASPAAFGNGNRVA